ncbi:hypothetical protein IMG5_020290 [Ichthyophthirius multifiliis]|uniref:Furin n=1 Tax=Ichthyophthirius multifiliis TaxID=5932 RepID=G0QKN8_ICHMU|nr:hypothetical protein IMG5_020290 [Ichthyophthirius multifiliis]EGR34217.1 hypothetical protein IMG5_020290 [Ichthyophthirius multifiliis]|eukprot:XP_004039521.1 hypothetical protein IMG5_020290 [Ichthyophthirius multifiliis]
MLSVLHVKTVLIILNACPAHLLYITNNWKKNALGIAIKANMRTLKVVYVNYVIRIAKLAKIQRLLVLLVIIINIYKLTKLAKISVYPNNIRIMRENASRVMHHAYHVLIILHVLHVLMIIIQILQLNFAHLAPLTVELVLIMLILVHPVLRANIQILILIDKNALFLVNKINMQMLQGHANNAMRLVLHVKMLFRVTHVMRDIIQTQGVIYVKNVMIIVKHVKMEQQIINVLHVIIIKFFYKLKNVSIIAIINNMRIQIKIVSNVILRVLLVRILIHVILVRKDHTQKEVHKNANYVTQIVRRVQKRANVYLVNRIIFQPKINNVNLNVIIFFPDSQGNCQPCDSNCLNCKQFNQCTECFQGLYLFNGFCSNEIYCQENTYLDQNECKTECPQNKFKNLETNTCDPCHFSCKRCTEAGNIKCLECENGLALNEDGKCEKKVQETNATTSKLMFKVYLVVTIYILIACIICHFLDYKSYFRNRKVKNFEEEDCKPKIEKSQLERVKDHIAAIQMQKKMQTKKIKGKGQGLNQIFKKQINKQNKQTQNHKRIIIKLIEIQENKVIIQVKVKLALIKILKICLNLKILSINRLYKIIRIRKTIQMLFYLMIFKMKIIIQIKLIEQIQIIIIINMTRNYILQLLRMNFWKCIQYKTIHEILQLGLYQCILNNAYLCQFAFIII